MSLKTMMKQKADWKRPGTAQDTTNTEYISGEAVVKANVRVCIQPAAAKEILFYQQRGMEITHTIFSTTTDGWRKDDRLYYGDRKFYVLGVRNLIELNRVVALDCLEYAVNDPRE